MSVSTLLRRDVAIGGLATLLMLVSAHVGSMSAQTLACLRDWLSIFFAVAVGLAIPAQLAWQTRRMVARMSIIHLQGTMNAVRAACELAEQAEYALVGHRRAERYCSTVFNQSQIDHAIRRVDGVDLQLLPNAACKSAIDSARENLHRFFETLREAVTEFNDVGRIPENGVLALHSAYAAFVRDTEAVHQEWVVLNQSHCFSYVNPSENP